MKGVKSTFDLYPSCHPLHTLSISTFKPPTPCRLRKELKYNISLPPFFSQKFLHDTYLIDMFLKALLNSDFRDRGVKYFRTGKTFVFIRPTGNLVEIFKSLSQTTDLPLWRYSPQQLGYRFGKYHPELAVLGWVRELDRLVKGVRYYRYSFGEVEVDE